MAARPPRREQPGLEEAARALIDRARRQRTGIDLLVQGYPESIAALHGVHADVVHAARRLLAREGRAIPRVPEEPPPRSDRPGGAGRRGPLPPL